MKTVKFLAKFLALGGLLAAWLWLVVKHVPVLLYLGGSATFFAYGILALPVVVLVGIVHWYFTKGSNKGKQNETSGSSGSCCSHGSDHGGVQ